jgi:hypothetical protein
METIGVIRGARTCISVSAYNVRPGGRGKMASAIGRRKDNPEQGGIPDNICGATRLNDGPCHPEGRRDSIGITPENFRILSTRNILLIANPESGAPAKELTTERSLSGAKTSSASSKQMISPELLQNAEFRARAWPPLR